MRSTSLECKIKNLPLAAPTTDYVKPCNLFLRYGTQSSAVVFYHRTTKWLFWSASRARRCSYFKLPENILSLKCECSCHTALAFIVVHASRMQARSLSNFSLITFISIFLMPHAHANFCTLPGTPPLFLPAAGVLLKRCEGLGAWAWAMCAVREDPARSRR